MKRMSPSVILSSVALFFSLCGAGLAASRYLITSVSQIKPNVRAELRGNTGPQGSQGAQGPAGAQGVPGPQGIQGPQGEPADIHWDGDYSSMTGSSLCSSATPECPSSVDLFIRCKPGDHVLNGGYAGSNVVVTTDALIAASGTTLGRGWEVTAHIDPAASSGSVRDVVICLADPNG